MVPLSSGDNMFVRVTAGSSLTCGQTPPPQKNKNTDRMWMFNSFTNIKTLMYHFASDLIVCSAFPCFIFKESIKPEGRSTDLYSKVSFSSASLTAGHECKQGSGKLKFKKPADTVAKKSSCQTCFCKIKVTAILNWVCVHAVPDRKCCDSQVIRHGEVLCLRVCVCVHMCY